MDTYDCSREDPYRIPLRSLLIYRQLPFYDDAHYGSEECHLNANMNYKNEFRNNLIKEVDEEGECSVDTEETNDRHIREETNGETKHVRHLKLILYVIKIN